MFYHRSCRGIGGLVTWLFIGLSVFYGAFLFAHHFLSVNGGYSEWSGYTSCSRKCEGGMSTRTRSCTNPIPEFGGEDCSKLGPALQTTDCNQQPCPVDGKYGKWGDYESCSVTCGGGKQVRHRKCDNPKPQYGGKNCAGEGWSRDFKACNENLCPVNGSYTNWGPWSSCSATCGKGQKTRSRTCTKPVPANGGKSCQDQKLGQPGETAACNEKPCIVPTTKLITTHKNLATGTSNNTV